MLQNGRFCTLMTDGGKITSGRVFLRLVIRHAVAAFFVLLGREDDLGHQKDRLAVNYADDHVAVGVGVGWLHILI